MKLENPMKIQRIEAEPQPRREQREPRGDGDNRRGGGDRSGPPRGRVNGSSDATDTKTRTFGGGTNLHRSCDGFVTEFAATTAVVHSFCIIMSQRCYCLLFMIGPPAEEVGVGAPAGGRGGPRRQKKAQGGEENAPRGPKRPSLRVGTGKKGRRAMGNQRRGSLKKRDRSAEKAARAEAAVERNTVSLPE